MVIVKKVTAAKICGGSYDKDHSRKADLNKTFVRVDLRISSVPTLLSFMMMSLTLLIFDEDCSPSTASLTRVDVSMMPTSLLLQTIYNCS